MRHGPARPSQGCVGARQTSCRQNLSETNHAISCGFDLLDHDVASGFIGDARLHLCKRTVAWGLYARAGKGGCAETPILQPLPDRIDDQADSCYRETSTQGEWE
jgi:hypothetical protein